MKTKGQVGQNMFLRIVTMPFRALVKARDLYVRSMLNCSEGFSYEGMGGVGGLGAVNAPPPLPRSFSSSSESEDYAELVRAASGKGSLGNKVDIELYLQQEMMRMNKRRGVGGSRKMPRSGSVAMGKIDEDRAYVVGDDEVDFKTQMKYPRSRSYVPTQRHVVF